MLPLYWSERAQPIHETPGHVIVVPLLALAPLLLLLLLFNGCGAAAVAADSIVLLLMKSGAAAECFRNKINHLFDFTSKYAK
jgi:hypothetical protein